MRGEKPEEVGGGWQVQGAVGVAPLNSLIGGFVSLAHSLAEGGGFEASCPLRSEEDSSVSYLSPRQ